MPEARSDDLGSVLFAYDAAYKALVSLDASAGTNLYLLRDPEWRGQWARSSSELRRAVRAVRRLTGPAGLQDEHDALARAAEVLDKGLGAYGLVVAAADKYYMTAVARMLPGAVADLEEGHRQMLAAICEQAVGRTGK